MKSNGQVRVGKWWQMVFGVAVATVLATGQAFAQPPAEQPAADKQEAWRKAWPILLKAEQDSLGEIDGAIKAVDQRFEEAKNNARSFVTDVLGWGGKGRYVLGGAEQAINGAAGLLDSVFGSKLSKPAGPDSFTVFARERFEHHVFTPEALKREIEAAAAIFSQRAQRIDAQVMVDLQADLPDGDPARITPAVRMEQTLLAQVDGVIQDAIADATTDFLVTAGKEAVSQVGGGWLTGMLMTGGAAGGMHAAQNQDPWSATAILVGVGVGLAVDKALDKVAEAAGHDPVGQLAGKVKARLERAPRAPARGRGEDRRALPRPGALPPWAPRFIRPRRQRPGGGSDGAESGPGPALKAL